MPTILWFVIAFILAASALTIITPIIENKKLIHKINTLWSSQLPLETFIRPNHNYSYQFDTYKNKYDTHQLLDDKSWSDLNLDTVFHRMNFNFTAIGEMRLLLP